MTLHQAQLQTLIAEIEALLTKATPRLPWVVAGEAGQQRRVLEQALAYLKQVETGEMVSLGWQMEPPAPIATDLSAIAANPEATTQQVLHALLQEMQYLRSQTVQPLRTEIMALQQQREQLLQEVRQLELARLEMADSDVLQLAPAAVDDIVGRLREALMAQLQPQLRALQAQIREVPVLQGSLEPASSFDPGGTDLPQLQPQQRLDQLRQIQAQTDQLLLQLDANLRAVFESMEQSIQSYRDSLNQGLDTMHGLGQQGEVIFKAFVNHLAQQLGQETSAYMSTSALSGDREDTGARLLAGQRPDLADQRLNDEPIDGLEDWGAAEEDDDAYLDLEDLDLDVEIDDNEEVTIFQLNEEITQLQLEDLADLSEDDLDRWEADEDDDLTVFQQDEGDRTIIQTEPIPWPVAIGQAAPATPASDAPESYAEIDALYESLFGGDEEGATPDADAIEPSDLEPGDGDAGDTVDDALFAVSGQATIGNDSEPAAIDDAFAEFEPQALDLDDLPEPDRDALEPIESWLFEGSEATPADAERAEIDGAPRNVDGDDEAVSPLEALLGEDLAAEMQPEARPSADTDSDTISSLSELLPATEGAPNRSAEPPIGPESSDGFIPAPPDEDLLAAEEMGPEWSMDLEVDEAIIHQLNADLSRLEGLPAESWASVPELDLDLPDTTVPAEERPESAPAPEAPAPEAAVPDEDAGISLGLSLDDLDLSLDADLGTDGDTEPAIAPPGEDALTPLDLDAFFDGEADADEESAGEFPNAEPESEDWVEAAIAAGDPFPEDSSDLNSAAIEMGALGWAEPEGDAVEPAIVPDADTEAWGLADFGADLDEDFGDAALVPDAAASDEEALTAEGFAQAVEDTDAALGDDIPNNTPNTAPRLDLGADLDAALDADLRADFRTADWDEPDGAESALEWETEALTSLPLDISDAPAPALGDAADAADSDDGDLTFDSVGLGDFDRDTDDRDTESPVMDVDGDRAETGAEIAPLTENFELSLDDISFELDLPSPDLNLSADETTEPSAFELEPPPTLADDTLSELVEGLDITPPEADIAPESSLEAFSLGDLDLNLDLSLNEPDEPLEIAEFTATQTGSGTPAEAADPSAASDSDSESAMDWSFLDTLADENPFANDGLDFSLAAPTPPPPPGQDRAVLDALATLEDLAIAGALDATQLPEPPSRRDEGSWVDGETATTLPSEPTEEDALGGDRVANDRDEPLDAEAEWGIGLEENIAPDEAPNRGEDLNLEGSIGALDPTPPEFSLDLDAELDVLFPPPTEATSDDLAPTRLEIDDVVDAIDAIEPDFDTDLGQDSFDFLDFEAERIPDIMAEEDAEAAASAPPMSTDALAAFFDEDATDRDITDRADEVQGRSDAVTQPHNEPELFSLDPDLESALEALDLGGEPAPEDQAVYEAIAEFFDEESFSAPRDPVVLPDLDLAWEMEPATSATNTPDAAQDAPDADLEELSLESERPEVQSLEPLDRGDSDAEPPLVWPTESESEIEIDADESLAFEAIEATVAPTVLDLDEDGIDLDDGATGDRDDAQTEPALVASVRPQAVPPPPPPPHGSAPPEEEWFLGIDVGTTGLSAVLMNRLSGKAHPLYWTDAGVAGATTEAVFRFPAVAYLTRDRGDWQVQTVGAAAMTVTWAIDTEADDALLVSQFKPLLTTGIPHHTDGGWQPIVQWSDQDTVPLQQIFAALQALLSTIRSVSQNLDHPPVGAAGLEPAQFRHGLAHLQGVIIGHPSAGSDTYIMNLREAVLAAQLVSRADQVFFVDEAIATVLSGLPDPSDPPLPTTGQTQALYQCNWQGSTIIISAGASVTELGIVDLPQPLSALSREDFLLRSFAYGGNALDQDIIAQLLCPPERRQTRGAGRSAGTNSGWNWQANSPQLANAQWADLGLEDFDLPRLAEPDPNARIRLQQRLEASVLGQSVLEAARHLKLILQNQPQFHLELADQSWRVMRRDLESRILVPYIQRINQNLNALLSQSGLSSQGISHVVCTGGNVSFSTISRWLRQKFPNATIIQDTYPSNRPPSCSRVAYGLVNLCRYPQVLDTPRHQYSDYFLLQEMLRVMPDQPMPLSGLLHLLEKQGINTEVCQQRILALLEGHLPAGLVPDSAGRSRLSAATLDTPTYRTLMAGPLFTRQSGQIYVPNPDACEHMRQHLVMLFAQKRQSLAEPLIAQLVLP